MRRTVLLGFLLCGLVAVACEGFGADDGPTPDAGASPDAAPIDATNVPDASAFTGTLRWETHGDPHFTQLISSIALAPAPDDRLAVGLQIFAAPSFGAAHFTGTGLGAFTIDPLGAPQQTTAFLPPSGSTSEFVNRIAVDSSGATYMAGTRSLPATDPDGGATYVAQAFLVKFDASGKLLWGLGASPNAGDSLYANASQMLAVATRGTDVVVTLSFQGNVNFGPSGHAIAASTKSEAFDTLVMFLDGGDGHALWWRQLGGVSNQIGYSAQIENNGDVLVGGYTNTNIFEVNDVSVIPPREPRAGGPAPFFVRFSGDEQHDVKVSHVGAVDYSGVGLPSFTAFAASSFDNGDIATCGLLAGVSAVDGTTTTLGGLQDGWVARYRADGGLVWLRTFGGAKDDRCSSLQVTPEQHVVIAVNHDSSGVRVGDRTLADPTSADAHASAVLRLDGDGVPLWSYDVTGGSSYLGQVAVTTTGDVAYAGYFAGAADLGGGVVQGAPDGGNTFFAVRRAP